MMRKHSKFTSPEIPDHLGLTRHNRKSEAIDLLEYLTTVYRTNDGVKDIRLGQLLLDAINDEHVLYHMESNYIKDAIDKFLNLDPNDY